MGGASAMEAIMNAKIDSTGLLLLLIVEFCAVLSSCCLCMKRKHADIMPNYLEKEPWDPYTKENIAFRANRAAAQGKDISAIDPTGEIEDAMHTAEVAADSIL